MKKLFALLLSLLLSIPSWAEVLHVSLSQAIGEKLVKADATNGGCYKGKCVQLNLHNNSGKVLRVTVDMGMIFAPDSSKYQPLVLAGNETIVVQPFKDAKMDVQTFCGNAPRACPVVGHHYAFLKNGSDTLTSLIKYINKKSLFNYLGQRAVWVVTNNHDLNGVYEQGSEAEYNDLIDLLTKLTGKPKPEYYSVTQRDEVPGAIAYVAKTLKIVAEFEQILSEPKTLTLAIYNSQGVVVQPVFEDQLFGVRGHRFQVEFEAEGVSSGNYYIRLTEGSNILQEKTVRVE